jgi:hypothetical protein
MKVGSSTHDPNLRRGYIHVHQTDSIASSTFVNVTHTFQLMVAQTTNLTLFTFSGLLSGYTAWTHLSEIINSTMDNGKRDSSVCIATSSGCNEWKIEVPFFSSSAPYPHRLWSTHSLLSNGYRDLSAEVKQPRREADHSLPSIAEVTDAWMCLCFPSRRRQ